MSRCDVMCSAPPSPPLKKVGGAVVLWWVQLSCCALYTLLFGNDGLLCFDVLPLDLIQAMSYCDPPVESVNCCAVMHPTPPPL
jgi:hypothetical protein